MCSADEDSLNADIQKLGELASILADWPDLRPWGPNKRKYRTIAWDDVRFFFIYLLRSELKDI